MTPEEFVAAARSWVGVPFRHQGRSRLGVDCAGFVECVLREAGLLPAGYRSPTNYGRRPGALLRRELERWCRPAPLPAPVGSLVAIRWPWTEYESHVAICAGETIIHAYREDTGVVEHGHRGVWLRRTESAWFVPGVTYE